MQFDEWEPVYAAILADFGYDRAGDERARDRLADLLPPGTLTPDEFDLSGATVAVAGAGPSLEREVDRAREADAVLAASTAAGRLADAGVAVDCVVTDLDKHGKRVAARTREGTPAAVHAHGDNLALLDRHVPDCDPAHVLATTQARPVDGVHNTGGFTDGDRAAFLADHCGAERLVFPGWDFADPDLGPEKAQKLRWAERLLHWLERRRGQRFAVLDGRREGIDASALPVD